MTIRHLTIPRNEDAYFKDIGYEADWAADDTDFPTLERRVLDRFAPMLDRRIMDVYGYRMIGAHPYERWLSLFDATIRSAVNREAPRLTALFEDSGVDIHDAGGYGEKGKQVDSAFPQNSLNPNAESYASDAKDNVANRHQYTGQLDAAKSFDDPDNPYRDPINDIVARVDSCFSHLVW